MANRCEEVDRLIATAHGARNVAAVIVGNEAILRGDVTLAVLIADIARVRAGVSVPVSTAEPWHVWLAHPELAAAVDVITVHLLPYWEGLSVDDAERFLLDKLDAVHAAYPGKPIVIGEVGWPSDGVAIGGARAGRVNQALFLRHGFSPTRCQRRGLELRYFVMEAFDQPWKTSFEGRAQRVAGDARPGDLQHQVGDDQGRCPENLSVLAGLGGAGHWRWRRPAVRWPAACSRRPDIGLTGKLLFAGLAQGFTAALAAVLMAMAGKYLSPAAATMWGMLAAGQAVLLLLLLADSFELAADGLGPPFGGAGRRLHAAPRDAALPKVSIHVPVCNEPPQMVRQTLDALAALDYPDFEVLVIDNNTSDPTLLGSRWRSIAPGSGARFRFFHLGQWPGFKAAALNFALSETDPAAERWWRCSTATTWCRRTGCAPWWPGQFADAGVAIVQSPQDYQDAGEKLSSSG